MGALFFLLGFIILIPLCVIGVEIAADLGLLGDMSDPPEWDAEEAGMQPHFEVVQPQSEHKHCVNQ